MFSGLVIIACLALFGGYVAQQDSIQETAYLEQPAVNDTYIVDFTKIFNGVDPKYKYGLMRIKQLSPEQAEFQVSKIAYNKVSGVRKDIRERRAASDSYYDSEYLYMDLGDLKGMKDSGAIYSIERI